MVSRAMQDNISARENTISELDGFGENMESPVYWKPKDEKYVDMVEGLEKLRDNKLVRFIAILMQSQR